MRSTSHKTKLSTLMHYVDQWKQQVGSREVVALAIVEAHRALGAEDATGIRFEINGDAFTLAKNAADRIFRWLDDKTKESNFMPANFEQSILAAMPQDLVLRYLNESLCILGFMAIPKVICIGGDECFVNLTQKQHKESSEATTANMSINENSSLEELLLGKKENLESLAKTKSTLAYINARIDAARQGIPL